MKTEQTATKTGRRYIATYDDKAASHTQFWTGCAWVIGVGNAKEFASQGEARTEGQQAIGCFDMSLSHLRIRTLNAR